MQVFVNGTAHACAEGCTLSALLDQAGIEQKSCATAVNGVFVPRDARQERSLSDNDQVMTFEPITGG
ncbi:MAG: sulfur carrier protein ThiS [Burkholderiaceae bacterium]|nr:sulfur carrier protein ThiS [Burkholderiaceae bacterium]